MRTAPLLAALGAAAVMGAVPAQADSGGTHTTDAGTGSISDTIEKFGQSICPSLVKPGSSLASTLSELQGNTGLTPTLTGMVAGFVIQTQCPSVMTKLAHGDLSGLQLPTDGDLPALLLPGQQTAPAPAGLDLSALLKGTGR